MFKSSYITQIIQNIPFRKTHLVHHAVKRSYTSKYILYIENFT